MNSPAGVQKYGKELMEKKHLEIPWFCQQQQIEAKENKDLTFQTEHVIIALWIIDC